MNNMMSSALVVYVLLAMLVGYPVYLIIRKIVKHNKTKKR